MMTFEAVEAFVKTLPGVREMLKWNHRTWTVNERGFAWQRPLSKTDLARFGDEPPPTGEILAVCVEDLDAKDALLAIGPPGFFTIQHFNGYPAVLIELRKAHAKDVRAAIVAAHRTMAARPPLKPRKPRPARRAQTTRRSRR
jgi:hypothetical protein